MSKSLPGAVCVGVSSKIILAAIVCRGLVGLWYSFYHRHNPSLCGVSKRCGRNVLPHLSYGMSPPLLGPEVQDCTGGFIYTLKACTCTTVMETVVVVSFSQEVHSRQEVLHMPSGKGHPSFVFIVTG